MEHIVPERCSDTAAIRLNAIIDIQKCMDKDMTI
jgi:hypothetical protein